MPSTVDCMLTGKQTLSFNHGYMNLSYRMQMILDTVFLALPILFYAGLIYGTFHSGQHEISNSRIFSNIFSVGVAVRPTILAYAVFCLFWRVVYATALSSNVYNSLVGAAVIIFVQLGSPLVIFTTMAVETQYVVKLNQCSQLCTHVCFILCDHRYWHDLTLQRRKPFRKPSISPVALSSEAVALVSSSQTARHDSYAESDSYDTDGSHSTCSWASRMNLTQRRPPSIAEHEEATRHQHPSHKLVNIPHFLLQTLQELDR